MQAFAARGQEWGLKHNPDLASSLLDEIRAGGARTARDFEDGLPRVREQWGWNWSDTKVALEYLFLAGEVAVARRNSQFERVYDLPERVLPRAVLDAPTPTQADAQLELVRRAARSHGIGTTKELADYYRMGVAPARSLSTELVESGELLPVEGRGVVARPISIPTHAIPRRSGARALLSPFDPVVWNRDRALRLFDFHYRIEIYTPAPKRIQRLLRPPVPARRRAGRPGRPQGRPSHRTCWCKAPGPSRARRRNGRLSWPPSCAAWPAGSASTTWRSSPAAISLLPCRRWSEPLGVVGAVVASRRCDGAATAGLVKRPLRRLVPLTGPGRAGDGAYRDATEGGRAVPTPGG